MNKSLFLALVGSSLLGLAACSGSGGSVDLGASAGESPSDYDDLAALLTDIENGVLTPEDTSAQTGAVTMTGAVAVDELGEDANLTLVGDLVMTADFDTDTASGSADGFTLFNDTTDSVESDVTGALTMSGGTITGSAFDATMSGTLVNEGDDFGVDLTLDGSFYDNVGNLAVGGGLTGTIANPDGGIDAVAGAFVATE